MGQFVFCADGRLQMRQRQSVNDSIPAPLQRLLPVSLSWEQHRDVWCPRTLRGSIQSSGAGAIFDINFIFESFRFNRIVWDSIWCFYTFFDFHNVHDFCLGVALQLGRVLRLGRLLCRSHCHGRSHLQFWVHERRRVLVLLQQLGLWLRRAVQWK